MAKSGDPRVPMSKRDFDVRILAIPLAIVLIGCVALGLRCVAKSALRTQDGDPRGAMIVRGPAAATLVLTDRVRVGRSGSTASGYRLTSIDAATGVQLGLRVFDDPLHCWPASPGRVWCATDDGVVSLVDVPSLETAATVDELLARSPLGKPVHGQWRVEGPDLIVLLPDGRGAQIEAATLAVTPASATGITGGSPVYRAKPAKPHFDNGDRLEFGDGPRYGLFRIPRVPFGVAPPAPPTPTPTTPTFLRKDRPPDLFDAGDGVLLVFADSSLDPKAAVPQVSRVDATPRLTWTAPLAGHATLFEVVGPSIVVTTDATAARAVALDRETGAVRWQFTF
jgi:hypothetical protein